MTTLESLTRIIGNVSRSERKFVRDYLFTRSQNKQRPNKMLKLFDLLVADHERKCTTAELKKRLALERHHATFGRLVSHLRKRTIEALSLPLVTACNENYSERTKALFHYHRQYLKALIFFEADDYASADETLLSLLFWTEKYELHAERMATAEFLMRTIRIYSQAESLKHFKDIPDQSRKTLSVTASAEHIREMIDEGTYHEARLRFNLLSESIKGVASRRALFVMKGIQAKAAATAGKYKDAEKLFFEQLKLCKHPVVYTEENHAQVYTDIAWIHFRRKKFVLARQVLRDLTHCKRKTKATQAEIEKLENELGVSGSNRNSDLSDEVNNGDMGIK